MQTIHRESDRPKHGGRMKLFDQIIEVWIKVQLVNLFETYRYNVEESNESVFKKKSIYLCLAGGSAVKNLPVMQEMCVLFLGQEDFRGEGNDNPLQYAFLGNAMDRGGWWLQSTGSQRVGQD